MKRMVIKSIRNTRRNTQRRPSGNYAPLNVGEPFRYEINMNGNPVRIPTDYKLNNNSNNNSIKKGHLRKLVERSQRGNIKVPNNFGAPR